jgi:large subunit ribosomal protein L32e
MKMVTNEKTKTGKKGMDASAKKAEGPHRKRPKKKKKPTFNVLNFGFMKSVKERWRRPRGTANKKRRKNKWAGGIPSIGYGNPAELRGMREDGHKEILVRGMPDALALKALGSDERAGIVLRLSSSLGKRKRQQVAALANELGVKIVNFRVDKNQNGSTKGE